MILDASGRKLRRAAGFVMEFVEERPSTGAGVSAIGFQIPFDSEEQPSEAVSPQHDSRNSRKHLER